MGEHCSQIQLVVWVVIGCQYIVGPCCLYIQGEDGSSRIVRNVVIIQHYTPSEPKKTSIWILLQWILQIMQLSKSTERIWIKNGD